MMQLVRVTFFMVNRVTVKIILRCWTSRFRFRVSVLRWERPVMIWNQSIKIMIGVRRVISLRGCRRRWFVRLALIARNLMLVTFVLIVLFLSWNPSIRLFRISRMVKGNGRRRKDSRRLPRFVVTWRQRGMVLFSLPIAITPPPRLNGRFCGGRGRRFPWVKFLMVIILIMTILALRRLPRGRRVRLICFELRLPVLQKFVKLSVPRRRRLLVTIKLLLLLPLTVRVLVLLRRRLFILGRNR